MDWGCFGQSSYMIIHDSTHRVTSHQVARKLMHPLPMAFIAPSNWQMSVHLR